MTKPLPFDCTREEAIEGLRETLAMAVEAKRKEDPSFVRWPDMEDLLDYIEQNGLPLDLP